LAALRDEASASISACESVRFKSERQPDGDLLMPEIAAGEVPTSQQNHALVECLL
jgi:hypothetical protein